LSDNSNDYDEGNLRIKGKDGAKLTPTEQRLKLQDPAEQLIIMDKLTRMNQQIQQDALIANANRAREREEEAERNLTPKQRAKREEREQEQKQRVEKITARVNKEKDAAIEIVNSFFDCTKEEFESFLDDKHTLGESPIKDLVEGGNPHETTGHLRCTLHDQRLIKIPNHHKPSHLSNVAFTVAQIEEHCKNIEPEEHKEELLRIIDEQFSDKLRAALREKDPTFDDDLKAIDAYIPSPPGYPQIRKKPPKEKTKDQLLKEFDNSL
jgi:hypothetical protein